MPVLTRDKLILGIGEKWPELGCCCSGHSLAKLSSGASDNQRGLGNLRITKS
jgi:hypothetical protein